MKISVGADDRLHVVDVVLDYLKEKGYRVSWCGTDDALLRMIAELENPS